MCQRGLKVAALLGLVIVVADLTVILVCTLMGIVP